MAYDPTSTTQNTAQNPQAGSNIVATNTFRRANKLKLILASDGTGNVVNNVANADLLIFQGYVPGNAGIAGNKPDGTHVTLKGNAISTTSAELLAYLLSVKMHVTKVTITTSDTTNYTGGNFITIGTVDTDGRVVNVREIYLNDYKNNTGTGVSDTLIIGDIDFVTGGNFFMKVNTLALSSNMAFQFDINATSDTSFLVQK